MTVIGSAFSVGGSSFVVSGGSVTVAYRTATASLTAGGCSGGLICSQGAQTNTVTDSGVDFSGSSGYYDFREDASHNFNIDVYNGATYTNAAKFIQGGLVPQVGFNVSPGSNIGFEVGSSSFSVYNSGGNAPLSRSIAQLLLIAPEVAGEVFFCNNCKGGAASAVGTLVVSTGTSVGNFVSVGSASFQ